MLHSSAELQMTATPSVRKRLHNDKLIIAVPRLTIGDMDIPQGNKVSIVIFLRNMAMIKMEEDVAGLLFYA